MKNDKTHHDLSRREFLRWSGTLAAGLAAAPLMAGVHQERTRKVRIGVVGGNFGASPGIIAHQSALQGGSSCASRSLTRDSKHRRAVALAERVLQWVGEQLGDDEPSREERSVP